jgi:hypothetical protein
MALRYFTKLTTCSAIADAFDSIFNKILVETHRIDEIFLGRRGPSRLDHPQEGNSPDRPGGNKCALWVFGDESSGDEATNETEDGMARTEADEVHNLSRGGHAPTTHGELTDAAQ